MLCRAWWGVVVLALVVESAEAQSPTTSYFRGDGGRAAVDAQPLPDDLAAPGTLVWKAPLDSGHSTPCIVGARVFVTTFADGKLATVALDANSGKVLWKQPCPHTRLEAYHPTSSPASSTPACDGQRVYAFFGSYGLLCYDLDGKLIWSRPMEPFQDEFGSSSSPVLVDDVLLLNEDHDLNSFLLCVESATGKVRWQTPRDNFTRSYATPIIREVAGRKQVIVAGALELTSYDLATGKMLWSLSGLARIVNTTPAADAERLYVATWSPGGDTDARIAMEPWEVALKQWDKDGDAQLTREEANNKDVLDRFFRIDLDQSGKLNEFEWRKYAKVFELARNSIQAIRLGAASGEPPQVVWHYDKGLPYVPSPLVYRGVVWLVKDGGIVTSLDAATGKVLKQARARATGGYYSSPVAGDGKVYLASDGGVITVLRAQGAWDILSSHDLAERTVATPVIDAGRIYVRTEKALYCFARGS